MALKLVSPGNPAIGAEFSVTVPAGKYWLVKALYFVFTTSATVASRTVKVTVDDGTTEWACIGNQNTQPASVAAKHTYMTNGVMETAAAASGTAKSFPFPDVPLAPGSRIRSVTGAMDTNGATGDTYTGLVLMVDEEVMEYALNRKGRA